LLGFDGLVGGHGGLALAKNWGTEEQ
jgi:hypothetical protein